MQLIKKWSSAAGHAKQARDIYSDSDDDLCHVRDENEEVHAFGALSLFLRSPQGRTAAQLSAKPPRDQ